MRLFYIIQVIIVILLISFNIISMTGVPIKIFGGRKKIDDPKEFNKAIETLKSTGLTLEKSRIKIKEVYKQVVSGMLYIFNCEIQDKKNVGRVKKCVIQVLNQPWKMKNFKVVKNTCNK